MKILYLGGESANFVVKLCNELCELGHEVQCVVQTRDEYDKENPVKQHKNLSRMNIPELEYFNHSAFEKKHLQKILELDFDIILASHVILTSIAHRIASITKKSWGVMILDIPVMLMIEDRNRMRKWLKWFELLKYADAVLFITSLARDSYEKFTNQHFPDENIITYAPSICEESFLSGLNINGDYVVSVCRLHKIKNCIDIPRALSLLENIKTYVAVGRNYGEVTSIKEECDKHDIEFVYFTEISDSQKCDIIKHASMLVYPECSDYQGAGLSPLEAMYIGTPVISPDLFSKREVFQDYPFYYEKDNMEDMAKQIAYVYSAKRDNMKERLTNAAHYVKNEINFTVMAEKLNKIIEKMVKK